MSSERIPYISRWMARLVYVLMATVLLLNAACWLYPSLTIKSGGYGVGFGLTGRLIASFGIAVFDLPGWQKLGNIVLSSVPLMATTRGLYSLHGLFKAYAQRDYFSNNATVQLRRFGRACVVWVILNLLCEPLLGIWLTLREAPGHHIATLSFVPSDAVALFLAACIAVIAHVLHCASALAAENRQFI